MIHRLHYFVVDLLLQLLECSHLVHLIHILLHVVILLAIRRISIHYHLCVSQTVLQHLLRLLLSLLLFLFFILRVRV